MAGLSFNYLLISIDAKILNLKEKKSNIDKEIESLENAKECIPKILEACPGCLGSGKTMDKKMLCSDHVIMCEKCNGTGVCNNKDNIKA